MSMPVNAPAPSFSGGREPVSDETHEAVICEVLDWGERTWEGAVTGYQVAIICQVAETDDDGRQKEIWAFMPTHFVGNDGVFYKCVGPKSNFYKFYEGFTEMQLPLDFEMSLENLKDTLEGQPLRIDVTHKKKADGTVNDRITGWKKTRNPIEPKDYTPYNERGSEDNRQVDENLGF